MGDEQKGSQTIEDEMADFDEAFGDDVSLDDDGQTDADNEDSDEEGADEEAENDEEEEAEEGDSDNAEDEEDEGEEEEDEDEELDDEDGEDDADDEGESPEEIILSLRKQLAESAGKTPQQQAAQEEADSGDEAAVIEDFAYATEENFDEIMRDPEAFNKAVNAGVKHLLEQANTINQQNAMQAMKLQLPTIVHAQVEQQRTLQESVDSFYKDHESLADFKPLVGANVNTVIASNPEMQLTEVMAKAADLTYKQLKLNAKAVNKTPTKRKKAKNTGLRKSGSKGSGNRGKKLSKTNKSALQAEMDELI